MSQITRLEVTEKPVKNQAWQTGKQIYEDTTLNPRKKQIKDTDRLAWYCPTATIWDAARVRNLCDKYDINHVYDLGAGDFRVSLWLASQGFDVVAYELHAPLVDAFEEYQTPNVTVQQRDYYEDYDDLVNEGAVVALGGTNELPYVPDEGLAIEGYGEIGIRAHYDGDVVAEW